MYIASMTVEDMERGPDPKIVVQPSWNDVESALSRMDGNRRSIVTLDAPGDDCGFMGIGGGENGVYVCFVIDADGDEIRLIDPTVASHDTFEVYMGQTNVRSKNEAVDLITILAVAKTYAESGELNGDYAWGTV